MKETDFPTNNSRSAKKNTPKTNIEKQRQLDVRGWNVHLPHQKVLCETIQNILYVLTYFRCIFPFCLHQFYVKAI